MLNVIAFVWFVSLVFGFNVLNFCFNINICVNLQLCDNC